jgi:hypothetical protein
MTHRVFLETLEPRLMLSADLGTVSTSLLNPDDGGAAIYEELAAPLGEAVESTPQSPTASGTFGVGLPLSGFCDPALEFDYAVITSEFLRDADTMDYTLDDFVARKEANGYATTVVTVEDIYANYTGVDSQEQIRNFIRDAHNSWGIEYVLLGGNAEVVPVRQVVNDAAGSPYIVSDMYYQCLDGSWDGNGNGVWGERNDGEGGGEIDWYSEVYIGRALVGTEAQLANWVYKTLDYDDKASEAYRHNALMVGEYTGFYANGAWGKYSMDALVTGSSAGGFTTAGFNSDPSFNVDTLYEKDSIGDPDIYSTVNWGPADILGLINTDDYGVYNHLGHGNGGLVMGTSDYQFEAGMTNENPFFLYSQACWPGYILTPGGVGEVLTTHTRTGAAATVLNTNYGWGTWDYDGVDGASQRVNRQFWDAAFSEGIYTLGAMNADSHEDMVWDVGNDQVRGVILDTTLFGDPTLEIFATDMTFLTDADLPTAYEGVTYDQQIEVIYGQGDYSFTITSGTLPDGVQLTSDGLLTGAATELGEFDFMVEATDTATSEVISRLFNLTIDEVLRFDVPTILPGAYKLAAYSVPLTVVGGTPGFTWELIAGELPDGLELDTATGVIHGTTGVLGEYSFTVQVTDSNNYPQVMSETFEMTVENLRPGFYGQIFDDTNGNGVRDAGEMGLNGHTVSLLDSITGAVVATAVTASVDANLDGSIDMETEQGLYSMEDVAAGRYVLQQDAVVGWQATTNFQSAQRMFMIRMEGGVSTIVEVNPSDLSVLASFPAPTTIAPTGFGTFAGLAVGPESLFYLDGSDMFTSATLHELDIETGDLIAAHALNNLPSGGMAGLGGMAWLDGKIYIQDIASSSFLVFNTTTGLLEASLPFATGVTFTGALTGAHDRGTLFIAGTGGEIFELSPVDGSVLNTLTPVAGVFSGGLAYVDGILFAVPETLDSVGAVSAIDATTGVLLFVANTGGGALAPGLAGDALPTITVGSYRVDLDDATAIIDMNFGATLANPYDLDGDGDVDADDIDLLTANFGNLAYDLNGDDMTDMGDVDHLLAMVFNTVRGDFNLDGKVDLLDLNKLTANYNTSGAGWALGDSNGDGDVQLIDLNTLTSRYGYDNEGVLALRPHRDDAVVVTSNDLTRIDVSEALLPTRGGALSVEASLMGDLVFDSIEAVDTGVAMPILAPVALGSQAELSGEAFELAGPIEISLMGDSPVSQTSDVASELDVVQPVAARQTPAGDDEDTVDILLEVDLLAL